VLCIELQTNSSRSSLSPTPSVNPDTGPHACS